MQKLLERAGKVFMNNVGRLSVVFSRGEGSLLYDADGKEYIDFLSGIAVQPVGHSHPRLVGAIQRQAERLIHVSNYFFLEDQILLAEKLRELSGMDRVFFCNSGAEANEAAIKLARKYGRTNLGGRYEIITAYDSFHGRTLGALAATGQPKYQEAFRPLPEGFKHATFNDLSSWEKAVTPQTCAVMIEMVQGEGGVNPISSDFIEGLVDLCQRQKLLLIVDEVQTGLGRTGKFLACEHFGVKPDIITFAKALGSGIPFGAMLAQEEVALAFTPGDHSTTIGGGGLAFTVGLEVLSLMEEEDLPRRAEEKGEELKGLFGKWRKELSVIKEIRGWGLLLALELTIPAKPLVMTCLKRGLVINAVTPTAIRLAPPLNIRDQDLDRGLDILYNAIKEAADGA